MVRQEVCIGHVCSSGDKLLEARQVGAVAASVGRPPPAHWVIATDGSAAPSSVEAPASAGWAFVVQREGLLRGAGGGMLG